MTSAPELSADQRALLRRAHERLRVASSELQALLATDPIKGRWEPEPAPPEILRAARQELSAAHSALIACHAEVLGWADDGETLDVLDGRRLLSFSFADLMRYHGPGSPGGVAHSYKVMEQAFALLGRGEPVARREVAVATAFGGPGARDGFEVVTRAVTGDRYRLDPGLARPELGTARERFVFRVSHRERAVTLVLREGFVSDEFVSLARKERTEEEEARLDVLKLEMSRLVMSTRADEVYDAETEG